MPEMDWKTLREDCLGCEKCALASTRTNVVFGVGNTEGRNQTKNARPKVLAA